MGENAINGCYLINDESTCLGSYDGRSGFGNSPCAWCCGQDCGTGYKCEPRDWLVDQPQFIGYYIDGYGADSCPYSPSDLSSRNGGCHLITSESQCLSSQDGRTGTPYEGQACAWCCGSACTGSEGYRCQPEQWLFAQPDYVGYSKNGLGSDSCHVSYLELSGQSALKKQAPWENAINGCYLINDESTCIYSYDGRSDFGYSACAW